MWINFSSSLSEEIADFVMDSFLEKTVRFRGGRVGVTVVGTWMIKGGRTVVVDLDPADFWTEKNKGGF